MDEHKAELPTSPPPSPDFSASSDAGGWDRETRTGAPTRRTVDGVRMVETFRALVEPIARVLPASTEVVLHDLSLVPYSIVAIHGNVTGRKIGDPPSDVLLEQARQGFEDYNLNYESTLPDGRRMRSSTMLIRDIDGNAAAALCIHTDLSPWLAIEQLAAQMARSSQTMPHRSGEVFSQDVDELAAHLIHKAIADAGIPLDDMRKKHKVAVVQTLQDRGVFLLRDAVEMVSEALGVTKFTIYNYLNELPKPKVS